MTSSSGTLSTLALTPGQRTQLARAARDAHPEECCGVLLGRAGGTHTVERVMAARNASTDRRRSFVLDPDALCEALTVARAEGLKVVGFYHSHPDGSPEPSPQDRRDAWPDMSYVIVPRGGELTSWRRRRGSVLAAERLAVHGRGLDDHA